MSKMPSYTDEHLLRWLGPGADPDAARFCLGVLDDQLQRRFGTPVYLSPGYTGLLAWKKRYGQDYRPLPLETQKLIRSTTTQGRFECCPIGKHDFCVCPELPAADGPCQGYIPALYCLDLRWAYVAAAMTITGGKEWRHEERPKVGWIAEEHVFPSSGYLGWTPARYLVRFNVSERWEHVGLLGVPMKSGWSWPADGHDPTKGSWMCWADACEVRLALECGWHVEILERLVCVDREKNFDRPLMLWAQNLLRLREDVSRRGGR
jgi:hypothetical protein